MRNVRGSRVRGLGFAAALLCGLAAHSAGAQQPAADPPSAFCGKGATQTQMNECAYDAFMAATADYSAAYKALSDKLSKEDVRQLQRVQKAWMAYRTATCDFESAGVKGGSAASMVQWQCATRYTRVRTAQLLKIAACPEGDLSCPRLRR